MAVNSIYSQRGLSSTPTRQQLDEKVQALWKKVNQQRLTDTPTLGQLKQAIGDRARRFGDKESIDAMFAVQDAINKKRSWLGVYPSRSQVPRPVPQNSVSNSNSQSSLFGKTLSLERPSVTQMLQQRDGTLEHAMKAVDQTASLDSFNRGLVRNFLGSFAQSGRNIPDKPLKYILGRLATGASGADAVIDYGNNAKRLRRITRARRQGMSG